MAASSVTCYIDSGIVVTFPIDVTVQHQQDVLNSLLFAQLSSDKFHQRQTDPEDWFSYFDNVLQNIGWVLSNMEFDVDLTKESTFVMSSFALNQMAQNGSSANEVEVFRKVFNELHSLPDKDPVIELLYKHVYNDSSNAASLILASFEVAKNDDVALKLTMFALEQSSEAAYRYLLHVYDSKMVTFSKAKSSKMVLNEQIYGRVRSNIVQKLGDRTESMILEIKLDKMASELTPAKPTISDLTPAKPTISKLTPAKPTISEHKPARRTVSEQTPDSRAKSSVRDKKLQH